LLADAPNRTVAEATKQLGFPAAVRAAELHQEAEQAFLNRCRSDPAFALPQSKVFQELHASLPRIRQESLFALGVCDAICSVVEEKAVPPSGARARMGVRSLRDWTDKLLWYANECKCDQERGDGSRPPQMLLGDHDRESLASGGWWLQIDANMPGYERMLPVIQGTMDAISRTGGVPTSSVVQISAVWPGSHVKPHHGPHNLRWRI